MDQGGRNGRGGRKEGRGESDEKERRREGIEGRLGGQKVNRKWEEEEKKDEEE